MGFTRLGYINDALMKLEQDSDHPPFFPPVSTSLKSRQWGTTEIGSAAVARLP